VLLVGDVERNPHYPHDPPARPLPGTASPVDPASVRAEVRVTSWTAASGGLGSVGHVPAPDGPSGERPPREVDVDLGEFLPVGVSRGDPNRDRHGGPAAEGGHEHEPAPFDPAVVERLEADLAAVDEALVAIDEGRFQDGPWDRIEP